MNKPEDILKRIGLSKNESLIYLTLLKMGPSQVSKIAKNSEIYRPYVYDTLERLSEKGLVNFIIIDGKRHFSATSPDKLLELENEKIDELRKAIPELNSLSSIPKNTSRIEVYSGKRVIKILQKDVLNFFFYNKNEVSRAIGVDERLFMTVDPVAMEQFFFQMKKNNFKEKVLVREGDNFLPGHEATSEYRFLSREFFEPNCTLIYGNKISMIIFDEPLHGIIIESKSLAQTYKKQFDLLWKQAKP